MSPKTIEAERIKIQVWKRYKITHCDWLKVGAIFPYYVYACEYVQVMFPNALGLKSMWKECFFPPEFQIAIFSLRSFTVTLSDVQY